MAPTSPAAPPCLACGHLRAALALGWRRRHLLWTCVAALLWPLEPEHGTLPSMQLGAPARAAKPAASAAAAAVELRFGGVAALKSVPPPAASPAASQASGAAFVPLPLRATAAGKPWGPVKVVQVGSPPNTLAVASKQSDWIVARPDGTLGAEAPEQAQSYRFRVRASDANTARMPIEQDFELAVFKPKGARPTRITAQDEQRPLDTAPGEPRTYQLVRAKLDLLLGAMEAAPPPEGEPEAPGTMKPPPGPGPTVKQLQSMLEHLLDQEYPTEALFRNAVQVAHCNHYVKKLKSLNETRREPYELQCPVSEVAGRTRRVTSGPAPNKGAAKAVSDKGAASAAPDKSAAKAGTDKAAIKPLPADDLPPSGAKTLLAFYTELLPADWMDWVVDAATQRHPMQDAQPLSWAGTPGCACVTPDPAEQVYGLFAYWHATAEPQAVQFSLFSRISYLGAVLNDEGGYALSSPPGLAGPTFVRQAQRHGTRVDLVLHKRDWGWLTAASDKRIKAVAHTAAENAAELADTTLNDRDRRLQSWLLPFWRESPYAFDGLTLFFEQAPADEAASARFTLFLDTFLSELVREMQARPRRAYRLNLVVPDHLIGEDGPYAYSSLIRLIESAERPLSGKGVPEAHKLKDYKGSTDITVEYLVLLGDPTTKRKKQLRERIDATATVQGHRRIALLESVVPVLLHPRGDKPRAMAPDDEQQFDRDLAYMKWNYGGVAAWPTPVQTLGNGESVLARLNENYSVEPAWWSPCARVCPNRVLWRLGLQALVVLGALALGLHFVSCDVRRLGKPYRLFLWLGGLVTAAVAGVLRGCDPALAGIPLSAVLAAVVALAVGLHFALKSKEVLP